MRYAHAFKGELFMAISTVRDVNAARFAVLAGVIVALISQIALFLLFTGLAGLALPPTAAAPATFNWSVFIIWSLAGVIAAGFGGFITGWSIDRGSDWDVGVLAFLGWAIAILLVTFFGAIAANAGSGLLRAFVSPAYAFFTPAEASAAARRTTAIASLASVIALSLGAAAAIVGSQIAASQTTPARRRSR
jgi:hypothetical protein